VIPAAESGTTMTVYVSGATAVFDDFASLLNSKLPPFIAVIIALGFVLLLVAFRGFGVPAAAAVMNLLSAGHRSASWSRSSSGAGGRPALGEALGDTPWRDQR
jgi:uncharacterized membrane protein YdfJ with MMPL/SSD domain